MRRAIFPGSFDPFTIGHKDIVMRALDLFDEIVIGVGRNADKKPLMPVEERVEAIRKAFEGDSRVRVMTYPGLTVDFAREVDAHFILRGIRCVQDFEYERNMAEANKELSGLETVLLYTSPQYAHISSSLVRDLYRYQKDISQYIP